MKKILAFMCIIAMASSIYAGCGGCGTDRTHSNDKNQSHDHSKGACCSVSKKTKSKMTFNRSTQKKVDAYTAEYEAKRATVEKEYKNNLSKVLTKQQVEDYLK